jgi:hypothetical protein
MKILFITHPYPNYVPDLLLHGLRKLLGPQVVDFPRKDCVYDGILGLGVCPDDQRCPGWFPADHGVIDRQDIAAKVAAGYFDLVVCDVRAVGFIGQHFSPLPSRLALIDGEDRPVGIAPGPFVIFRRETDGTDFSIPLPMALPEEMLLWISSFDETPKTHSIGFLGSTAGDDRRQITEIIARHYPDALLAATAVPTAENPRPGGRLGRNDYYRALQSCRLVLSLSGAGHDTFRFWENAACNAVHVSHRFPLFIPDDFREGLQILRFDSPEELPRQLDKLIRDDGVRARIAHEGRRHLERCHLTGQRASYFIDRARRAFGI